METHVHLTSPQDVQYQPGPVCALEILHRRDGNIDLSGPSIEDPLKWARKPLPKDCIGGLRIMSIPVDQARLNLPFKDLSNFEAVLRHLSLLGGAESFSRFCDERNEAFSGLGGRVRMAAFHPRVTESCEIKSDQHGRTQAWVLRGTFIRRTTESNLRTSLISYSPQSNIVSIFGQFGDLSDEGATILEHYKHHAYHPMLIPMLCASSYTHELCISQPEAIRMGLEDLEAHVKSEPYVGSTNNLQAGTISSKANEALQEFTEGAFQNIADMERLTSDLMVFLPSLNACLLDPICDAIHDLEQFMVAASDPSFARALISPIGREFKTRINMMRQDIGLLRAHAELYKTRFETHKSTLHIMFAHHDNSINMKIALESKKNADANLKLAKQSAVIANATKRDSSSMKSIALLTMVFLPGTFMATLVASPMIGWTAEDFWKYWAITIPLTFVVMGIWGTYMYMMNRRHIVRARKDEEKEDNSM